MQTLKSQFSTLHFVKRLMFSQGHLPKDSSKHQTRSLYEDSRTNLKVMSRDVINRCPETSCWTDFTLRKDSPPWLDIIWSGDSAEKTPGINAFRNWEYYQQIMMMVGIKRAWKILPLNSVSTIINASPNIWKIEKTQATNIQKYLQILFESFQSLNFSATQ